MQFLTCLPVGSGHEISQAERDDALLWYPLAGAAVGAVLIAGGVLSSPLSPFLQAALLVALWAGVTGALHLDGLADCADAWAGGFGSRETTLQILKDSRCGAVAVVAVSMALIVKVAALTAGVAWVALLVAPVAARLMIIPAFLWLPYVGSSGVAGEIQLALTEEKRKVALRVLAAGALALLMFVSLWQWLALAAVAGAVFALWRVAMMRRLQGFTGDCIGLLVEVSELAFLIAFAAFGL